ncbi:hypothetical protein ABG79_00734 [Caloramator mitchellensis]|uniref:LTXXQ motif protein n=1 Tax=Caloramator mitchellensis TaxID=908809 RepID=A0A0R3K1X0_CALMK|nr:hypothetical protein [Caloramator mitchellensis]KRQ87396.1 hypothetical protein ABG79_00734 [Caloramator mitchellensis]
MKRKIAYMVSALLIVTSLGSVASAKSASSNKNLLFKTKTFVAKEFKNKDGKMFFKFKTRCDVANPFGEKFNNLTLEQKKELIKKHFEEKINLAVKNGRLTQEQADKILKEFQEKLNAWDGKTPMMFKERLGGKFDVNFDNLTLAEKKDLVTKHFQDKLNFLVKNGKITQEQSDKMLNELKNKLNSWDGKRETLREIKRSIWELYKPSTSTTKL